MSWSVPSGTKLPSCSDLSHDRSSHPSDLTCAQQLEGIRERRIHRVRERIRDVQARGGRREANSPLKKCRNASIAETAPLSDSSGTSSGGGGPRGCATVLSAISEEGRGEGGNGCDESGAGEELWGEEGGASLRDAAGKL